MAGAIEVLKQDHRTVEDLFKQYEEAEERTPSAQKVKIRDQVVKHLSVHAYIEETVFYPATEKAQQGTEEMVKEALEEHSKARESLRKLTTLDPEDSDFDAEMRHLITDVRHHVEEEENDMFPKVSEVLSSKELSELGDRLEQAKAEAPESPA
jgi:hemerythrin superfamily protein